MVKKASIKEYYDSEWENISGYQMSEELAQLGYSWVTKIKARKCLDIGCGDGTNAINLKKLGLTVEGCDISSEAVQKAVKNGVNARVIDLNGDKIPYKESAYDLIWLSDVIEHVFWPDNLLDTIHALLKKGGHLFITTPNVSWYIIRLQILFGETLYDVHPQHIRWFNQHQLHEIIKEHGFEIVEESSYLRVIPFPISQKLPILRRFDKVGDVNRLFSHSFAILVKKK